MKVKIYTTQICPFCNLVKDFLIENKIPFEEIDVQNDREAAMHIIEKTGQMGVPVTEIDGKFIVGFNEHALREALKIK